MLSQLNIRNYTQLIRWIRLYKNEEMYRFEQRVGKQYSYGKGPEFESETSRLQAENRDLRQQIEILKKYKEVVPETVVNLVEKLKGKIPVYRICEYLGISRSTYYRWEQ